MSDDNRSLSYLILSYLILSYLLFRLFPIPFVAMAILLNTKIKSAKKDSNPSYGSTTTSTLNAQKCECPGWDSVDNWHNCPKGQIRCFNKLPWQDDYCWVCFQKICPSSDTRIQNRDSECPTGQIMCYHESIEIINRGNYCHKV